MKTIQRSYVVALPLNHRNNLLLQRKDRGYKFWPNYWCTFGGGMKDGEGLEDTFLREMREENGLLLTYIAHFESQIFFDETKFGDPLRREGVVHYFSARFDGDLKKVKIGEGAGFSLFDKDELARYNQLGLIVPYNYTVIEKLMNSL
ncbi:NUDIX hydrolase [Candidatus Pacearchaeota archaeon]|nr:NUDIX hydrolase [Candidatus Pacearchaeota archaeon]